MTRVRNMSQVACGTRQDNVVVQMYSSQSGQEICIWDRGIQREYRGYY